MSKIRFRGARGRVEPVMATAVTRPCHYAANVALALLAPACYLLIAGTIIAALASGAQIGVTFGEALKQAVVGYRRPGPWSRSRWP
ncbi:MAG: hypothetical protein ACOYEV_09410 [Candidatus Nanopelagicales bacterium]